MCRNFFSSHRNFWQGPSVSARSVKYPIARVTVSRAYSVPEPHGWFSCPRVMAVWPNIGVPSMPSPTNTTPVVHCSVERHVDIVGAQKYKRDSSERPMDDKNVYHHLCAWNGILSALISEWALKFIILHRVMYWRSRKSDALNVFCTHAGVKGGTIMAASVCCRYENESKNGWWDGVQK